MSEVYIMIWVIWSASQKYLEIPILMVCSMQYPEDGTLHENIDSLFCGMSLRWEHANLLGSVVVT